MISAFPRICFILVGSLLTTSFGDSMLGPGLWRVLSAEPCAGEFPVRIEVARRKVNRSHDGFNVNFDYDKEVDDTYGVRVDICKRVDGGCKPYMTLADESLPHFVEKYAADNVRTFLALGDIDPPQFPIPGGAHSFRNYVFNYEELPRDAVYGAYSAHAFVLRAGAEVACARFDCEFTEDDAADADDADER